MERIFNPQSIAIIGASSKPNSIGNLVVQNLIDSKYAGKMFPINPTAPDINGIKAYRTIGDVPLDEIDLAVYTVPAKFVVSCAKEAAAKRVKGHVVITSGFSEVGNTAEEEEMVRIARATGGRVVGPNIVGLLLNSCNANASFAPYLPYRGATALVSQSGALLIALDGTTFLRHFGCSSMVSLGNMADVDFADTISYLSSDPTTQCIALYIEGVKNGRAFIEAGRNCTKPIVALKSGVSAHGAAAAASHTGSLAGAVKIYDAAFNQAKIVRAMDLEELLVASQALSMQPPMHGDNILVITNGGGIGVLSADAAEFCGIPLKSAPKDLQDLLYKCMPSFGSPKNPVDITGGSGAKGYEDTITIALQHEWVHGIAVLYCETSVTNPMAISESIERAYKASPIKKPLVCCYVGGQLSVDASYYLMDKAIPVYADPKSTMSALSALHKYGQFQSRPYTPFTPFPDTMTSKERAMAIISGARAQGRDLLTEPESKAVFVAYNLPVPKFLVATSEDDAVAKANQIGYPVVMKIVSPQIIHKSDAGGVKVNVRDDATVRLWYNKIRENALAYNSHADIHGIIVCSMADWGKEVIVGSVNDSTFGPTVMFGMGGIFVEVLKDVTFRVAPFTVEEARVMLPEIKCYPMLSGARGEKPRDVEALAVAVSRISQMVHDLGSEVSEVDANPIMVYEQGQGIFVVDGRIILKSTKPVAKPTHGH
ncbi:CoA-binding protein [Pelomyxa schiedti]|nr:CoA-binding protein [Pelomyxa schiedti]